MALRRRPRWEGLLGLALLGAPLTVVGCAGFKAYEAPNHREEGPEKGLFTGSKGAFVLERKEEDPQRVSADGKSRGEPESATPSGPDSN